MQSIKIRKFFICNILHSHLILFGPGYFSYCFAFRLLTLKKLDEFMKDIALSLAYFSYFEKVREDI
jgi:hypothetical protein